MTNQIQKASPNKMQTLQDVLKKYQGAFQAVLPKHMSPERIVKMALSDVRNSPQLLQCDPKSLALALLQMSELALEPGSALGHAYFVPYKNECKMIVGYRGMIELVRRSGRVTAIDAQVVREGDQIDFDLGDTPYLKHKPKLCKRGEKAGDVVAAYAIARVAGSDAPVIEIMDVGQVDAIRSRSKSGGNGPWVTDYAEMARKTVVRRICKRLPMSVEVARVVQQEEREERDEAPDYSHLADTSPEARELVGEGELAPALGAPEGDALKDALKARAVDSAVA
jgi:recombination protein RecT